VAIRVYRWVGVEFRDYPIYDGTSDLRSFLIELEDKVVPEHIIPILDVALISSSSRWCTTHKGTLTSWDEENRAIQYWFISPSLFTRRNKDHEPCS
jgi:hypothetical protein